MIRRVRWDAFDFPAVSVDADDPAGFAAALVEAGIPGEDARGG